MNKNITNNEIIQTILKKIESGFKEDISIFACYGSFVTGTMNSLSDIDFFIIPKNNRGYKITESFIINDIGYDLWAIPWEEINEISNLTTPITSILMDAEVLFHYSEEDLLKFENYRKKVKDTLDHADKRYKLCMEKLVELQSDFFDLEFQENENEFYLSVIYFLEAYLLLLATVNGRYIRKGLDNLIVEISEFRLIPDQFPQRIDKILNSKDRIETKKAIKGLLSDIKGLIENRKIIDVRFDPNYLRGFYEEFKSIYNKLLNACETKNLLKAVYSSKIIDSETHSLINDSNILSSFPVMIQAVRTKNFQQIKKDCKIHENILLELYNKHGIPIKNYQSIEKFTETF